MKLSWVSRKLSALGALLLVSSLVAACSPPRKQEATLTRAYRLIDAQRTDDAIVLLEKSSQDDPKNAETQVALASAYAHKAGVRIQKLWKLVQSVKTSNGFFSALNSEPGKKISSGEQIDESLNRVASMMHKLARAAEIYAAIPNVDPDKRQFLDQAILILDAVEKPRPGDIVFRLILKIVQFKSAMAMQLIPEPGTQATAYSTEESCVVDLERTTAAVTQQAQLLVGILDDALVIFPEQEKQLGEIRMKIAGNVSNLTSGVSSLIVFEMASRSALKASVVENNFGKLLKCGGAQH